MRTFHMSSGAWAIAGLLASCATPDSTPVPPTPPAGDVADAFGAHAVDPALTAAMIAHARDLVRPGSVIQTEPRLGVPTFLWARPAVRATTPAALTGVARPEIAASRAALASYAPLYGLGDDDVAGAIVAQVHDLGHGPVLVKFRAQLGGIEIFREELSVVMNRKLEPIALSGYLTSTATPPAAPGGLAFSVAAASGAASAIAHQASAIAGVKVDPSHLIPAGSHDGYDYFTLSPAAGLALDEPVRMKRVYYHTPAGLEAAYYIEVIAHTGAPAIDVLSADGNPMLRPEAFAYVVSAATGQLLSRTNLIAEAARSSGESNAVDPGGFTYRVWADPVTGFPFDTPAGNGVDPKLNPVPDGVQFPFVATSDVTLSSLTFSQHDPWLPTGATETVGNNVDAFLNLFSPDGLGNPITPPTDPATGDFRAQITAPGQFLHAQIPDGNGALAEGRQGAIQQLFYNINFLHDWYYDTGFNEISGNAQDNNFNRGGVANDSIKGQAQDFSGFANANMLTPADGGRPRMRMYVFPSPANHAEIRAPAGIAGNKAMGISMSGPQTFDITADVVAATFGPTPTCAVTNAAALDGKIALFDFDNTDGTNCAFNVRIASLTSGTTASALAMVFTAAQPNTVASITGFLPTLTKPVVTVSNATGALIKPQLTAGATVTLRLLRAPDRDGAIDQQIVFHEFFHYVSNRLVGNGSGLGTEQSAGMGEGWSDVSSMLLTVRENDSQVPSNATFNGVYSLAGYATSGVPFDGSANQGWYFGVRRYPYSTDMTKNPLTFGLIANGVPLPVGPPVGFGADGASNAEVHNVGEVWATMLWECYASLLRDTLGPSPRLTFQQAQDRMKQYVIGGLKVTPGFPTITEARDAVLAVALASDPVDYVKFRIAFAKRGAGPHAVSPDRLSTTLTGVVEDFSTDPQLGFETATLDDSAGSCDDDGVLDAGEYGKLTVTLRNLGAAASTQTTATVGTTSPDIWYPDGTTLTFPSVPSGGAATASLRVAYLRTVVGIQQVDLQLDFADPQLTGTPSRIVSFRTNTDETPASSATDTVEAVAPAWTPSFTVGPGLSNPAPWHRAEVNPLQHVWHADDAGAGADEILTSPVMTVDAGGSITVELDHSWGFEFDATGNFDGGVIEMAVNGAAFTDIGAAAYNGTIAAGGVNPLHGRPGFVQSSTGTVHTSLTQAVAPGSTVQVRFRAGSDAVLGAAGWTLDNIKFTGIVETPFATVVPETGACTKVPVSADLAISVTDGVTSVHAGGTTTYTITATNAGGDDIIGATVSDVFSPDLTCTWTCTPSAGATCATAGAGNLADRISLPAGGIATYTATCAVSAATVSTSLSNTASIALPGPVTDPQVDNNTSTDTDQLLRAPAHLFGSKTVTGSFVHGGTVTYAIVLGNDSAGTQFDNAGNEMTDVLPAGLTLVSASATSGTAVATVATNTVTWDGSIPAGGSVTITIVATISATAGTTISNQASFKFDTDGDATNETTGTTDAFPCPP
jgi:uncharacterized repeat protein (TIGR01451 family)